MRLRYVSPLNLPTTTIDALQVEDRASVCVTPPGLVRHFSRHAPEFIDDPAATGLFTGFAGDTYNSPPVFMTVIPQATLFGYRALAWDGQFCTDDAGAPCAETDRFLQGLAAPEPFPNEDTGLRPAPDGDGFEIDLGDRPQRELAGSAVVLCSHEPSNYGSFLFRVLPKIHTVRSHGLKHLPMIAWAHGPQFVELLRLLGVTEKQVIQHETHVRTRIGRALAPSLRNPHAFLDPESRVLFRNLARTRPDSGVRRIYVSRMGRSSGHRMVRRMVNEAEVADAMERLGFTVIEPERMAPIDQVAAFASADIVVGPAGSAMFNMIFAKPETKVVDIESEPHWIYAHAGLFASCQARYGLFIGACDPADAAPVHRRFSVDVPALVDRVAAFLAT